MRPEDAALDHFTRVSERAARGVISGYSTSFGMATRLLGKRHRQHVRNIYAMVRVADEIVDGVTAEAGMDAVEQSEALESYSQEVHRAMRRGYSSDLIIHAFSQTARAVGIDESLTQPFFDSMAADVQAGPGGPENRIYERDDHARYVFGSAEVVGLMCLRVFLQGRRMPDDELVRVEHGARQLGAAFQNINFLRDLADDTDRLRRSYLSAGPPLDDAARDEWIRTIRAQLTDASATIPALPRDARAAVRSALALFSAVSDRVAAQPASELYRTRVRVPDPIKAALTARAVVTTVMERER